MTKKKTILIPGWSLGDLSFGCGKYHLNYISEFGIPRILMPQNEDVVEADLLYLPGGLDLNPSNYGEAPGFFTSNSDVYKEYFYRVMLPKYVESGIPIYGCCLGAQMLNVFFGGTLTQHLHNHPESAARGAIGHRIFEVINIVEGGLILESRKTKEGKEIAGYNVNSHHHQGILFKDLSPDIIPMYASKDGVIEIFKHKTLPIVGAQMHAEEYRTPVVDVLIEELLYGKSNEKIVQEGVVQTNEDLKL